MLPSPVAALSLSASRLAKFSTEVSLHCMFSSVEVQSASSSLYSVTEDARDSEIVMTLFETDDVKFPKEGFLESLIRGISSMRRQFGFSFTAFPLTYAISFWVADNSEPLLRVSVMSRNLMEADAFENVIVLPRTDAVMPLFWNWLAIPLAVFSRLNC